MESESGTYAIETDLSYLFTGGEVLKVSIDTNIKGMDDKTVIITDHKPYELLAESTLKSKHPFLSKLKFCLTLLFTKRFDVKGHELTICFQTFSGEITKPLERTDEIIPYGEDIPFLPTVPSSVAFVGSVKFSHEDNGAIICLAELEPKNGRGITCEVYLDNMATGFAGFPLCYKTGQEVKYQHSECRRILRNKMIQAYNDHLRENKQSSVSFHEISPSNDPVIHNRVKY